MFYYRLTPGIKLVDIDDLKHSASGKMMLFRSGYYNDEIYITCNVDMVPKYFRLLCERSAALLLYKLTGGGFGIVQYIKDMHEEDYLISEDGEMIRLKYLLSGATHIH